MSFFFGTPCMYVLKTIGFLDFGEIFRGAERVTYNYILLLYNTTFVKLIIHKLMCSNALNIFNINMNATTNLSTIKKG